MKRDFVIVYFRALAIIMIVFHHSIISLQGWPPVELEPHQVPPFLSIASSYAKSIGLTLFTFISGFLVANGKQIESYLHYFTHKGQRILLPCIITALFYYILFPNRMYNGDPINGTHLWYLPMIFLLYFFSPLINRKLSFSTIIIYFIVFVAFNYLTKLTGFRTFSEVYHYMGFFLCGAYFRKNVSKINCNHKDIMLLFLLIILLSFNYRDIISLHLPILLINTFVYASTNLILLICGLYLMMNKVFFHNFAPKNVFSRCIEEISAASYIIYILHQFVINFVIELYLLKLIPLYLIPILGFVFSFILPLTIRYLKEKSYVFRSK